LLNVVKKMSAKSPGTAFTARIVPRMSISFTGGGAPSTWTFSRSGMVTSASRARATTVKAVALTRTKVMPPKARANPLATEVNANAMPTVVPNSPFARSRRSSGTMCATSVGIAML
jgi:hypothetical protein